MLERLDSVLASESEEVRPQDASVCATCSEEQPPS